MTGDEIEPAVALTHPVTPDGRYLVVRGRLWRRSNPALPESARLALVRRLMRARREVRAARQQEDPIRERLARRRVHRAKVALGERGPVWWGDGAPDYNRRLALDTPYRDWLLSSELDSPTDARPEPS